MKVAFHTLGCKVNQYETQAIREEFEKNGFFTVEENEFADVYVINTCTVTNLADRKSRQYIRRMKRLNPDSIMVATGCYVQMSKDELINVGEIDLLIGNNLKSKIYEMTMDKLKEKDINRVTVLPYDELKDYEDLGMVNSIEGRTRAYIKIQEGCNRFCSYCIIPYARGKVRSRQIDEIKKEAEILINKGYKEIVLTGINTALYGRDIDLNIEDAIRAVCSIDGDFRVRLSSLEPTVVTKENINSLLKYDKLCHHLHLSLQSGSNKVLKNMNRKYTREEYLDIVKMLRSFDETYNITTDIIVGFPGETEEDFNDSLEIIEKAVFGKVHGFKFSKRKGTKAALMNDVIDGKIKNDRIDRLLKLAEEKSEEFRRLNRDKITTVLFEEKTKEGLMAGFTDNYIKVYTDYNEELVGEFVRVKLLDIYLDGCLGEIVGKG
jgi:threonylcarbamoyladenosine tRNA methylthiotransferase MtaB